MLPRNGGGPRGGRALARPALDARKVLLAVLALVFVAYFAAVNMVFSMPPLPSAELSDGGADAHAKAVNTAGDGDYEPAAAAREELADELEAEEQAEAEKAAPRATQHAWQRKPDRQYVWLDVAIDDVFIGRVTAELYTDLVPKTAENFRALTTGEKGPEYSFKNSVCHRILKGFIVQCGDFTTGKGYGGRSIYGNKFDDEPNGLRLTHSKRYILQMANAGKNTNGSQFCFMLGPAPHLNGHHVVFGEVVDGFHVVDRMEDAGVERDGIALEHKVQFLDGGEYL